MPKDKRRAKPDDRSDNVEKLQDMIDNTLENIDEAEATMEISDGLDVEDIKDKNKRRREAIQGFRAEIKDEHQHQEKQ